MSNNSEQFRTQLLAKLSQHLSQEQILDVLKDFDLTAGDYEITRKPVELIPIGGIPESVGWFIAAKTVKNLSSGTLKQYAYRLKDFFTIIGKPFQDISAGDIRGYLYYYQEKHAASDTYRDGIRRILNSYFTWCVNNGHLLRNPCAIVESIKHQDKEREPLTPYELEELRWNCKNVREKAVIDFLYSTGCRAGEFVEVKKSHIDWNRRSVIIPHGKGNKYRIVFFNAESELTLRKYLDTRKDDCEYLFCTSRRPFKKLEIRTLQTIVRNIGKRCDLHTFPHKMRHTFATSGLRAGIPIHQLQLLMGHEKPETTMIYAKNDINEAHMNHQRAYNM